MSKIWERIRKINCKYSAHHPPVLIDGGVPISNPRNTTEILANYFESVSNEESYLREFINVKNRDERHQLNFRANVNIVYNKPITNK